MTDPARIPPADDPRRVREYAYCTACPKLCRFSCPVSEAERRETVTPWGKMDVGTQLETRQRPLDASSASAVYACSDCGRCTEHCKHGNQVAPALVALRAEAVRANVAPPAVSALANTFAAHGSPFRTSLHDAARAAGMSAEGTYFPGCTALVKDPGLVADARRAAGAVGLPLQVSPLAGRCCGYPLYAAGHLAAFTAHAESFAEAARSAPPGPAGLIVGDPGCAFTLAKLYPQVGVALPEVRLWVDEVARRLPAHTRGRPVDLQAAYHDPCHLGRGLGRYEAPRAILQHALGGEAFAESPNARADAGCSGGGGVLPRTHPETAAAIARRQGEALGGGTTVVTACPAARRMFEKAGRPALALETVLARFFDGDASDPAGS